MEMEIISKEIIKPSSPTPSHLKNYQLSKLDQIAPETPVPIVLYFPASIPHQNILSLSSHLKTSLSIALTRFYPLAGRASPDDQSIDCDSDGGGVPFTIVEFPGKSFSDFLQEYESSVARLAPSDVAADTNFPPGTSVLSVQLNYFACGSFALCAVFWHKAVDVVAMAYFLKSWATIDRGCCDVVSPNYIAHSLFPKNETFRPTPDPVAEIIKTGKTSMNRYVFDCDAIASLKAKSGGHATRVEVVSAVIWKCFMVASLARGYKSSSLFCSVNLRRRAKPMLSHDCFGNFVGFAFAITGNDEGVEFGILVKKFRDAVSSIDGGYVNRMLCENGFMGFDEILEPPGDARHPGRCDTLGIISWCSSGLYNVEFGFGSPGWVTKLEAGNESENTRFLNTASLMDCKDGGGIEAWVTFGDDYMTIFDECMKLEASASKNPLPQIFTK